MNVLTRSLSDGEKSLLSRLLSPGFPGVSELRNQASAARAISTSDGTILFDFPEGMARASVISQHPVLGTCILDGTYFELELFVVEGRLKLMGFVILTPPHDPKSIAMPRPESVSVYVAEGSLGPYSLSIKGDLPTFVPRRQPT